MAKKPKSGDYQVGHSRPPVEHQFKPGNNANPHGRPKGSPNLATVLKRAARKKVKVTEGGRQRTMTMQELIIEQLFTKGGAGDIRAAQLSIEYMFGVERIDAAAPTISAADRAKADAEMLKALKGRLLGGEPKEN